MLGCLFADILVGTRSSASPAIYGRKDFDPIDKHKYAFTIFTSNRYKAIHNQLTSHHTCAACSEKVTSYIVYDAIVECWMQLQSLLKTTSSG